MLVPVLVVVGLVLALVGFVFAWAFFDVAIRLPGGQTPPRRAGYVVPLMQGADLRNWAKAFARRLADLHLTGKRGGRLPLELAAEVERSTSNLISRSLTGREEDRRRLPCPCRHDLIGITAPEALNMADQLRRTRDATHIEHVRQLARHNVQRLADPVQGGVKLGTVCPLWSAHGGCDTFESRPLYCRSRCDGCDGGCDDVAFAQTVGEGVAAGLAESLDQAQLDGRRFELNGALLAALDTPQASERWASGEGVFVGCPIVPSTSA